MLGFLLSSVLTSMVISRKFFSRFVGSFMVFGLLSCWSTFIGSLAPSQKAINEAEFHAVIQPQEAGHLQVVRITSQKMGERNIFVFLPTVLQRKQLETMASSVHHLRSEAILTEAGAYVFWGYDTKWGRPLSHVPSGGTFYSRWWQTPAPPAWQGGFWSESEVSYDYSGRSISEPGHTYNGYTAEFANLGARHISIKGNSIVVKLL